MRNTIQNRLGITIIEVLTAMVVAMIGVFGVMILIPFAVKQSEVGLDLDDAYRQAQSGVAQFEIMGFQQLELNSGDISDPDDDVLETNWYSDATTRISTSNPDVYAIDPLSIFGNGESYDQFPPSFSIEQYENRLSEVPAILSTRHFPHIAELNLGSGGTAWTGNNGIAMARRIFRGQDDLVMADAADDLYGPQQVFDQFTDGITGVTIDTGRQSRGEMSWMGIVAPTFDYANFDSGNPQTTAWKYRMFVLSYKNRVLTTAAAGLTPPAGTARFPVGEVDSASRPVTDEKDIAFGGGNIELTEPLGDVRKDDWLMLINLNPDLPVGFQKQIGFYRVVATFNQDVDNDGTVDKGILSLDGPDFVFNRRVGTTDTWRHMPTFAVLLANYDANAMIEADPRLIRLGHVVSVHERTFTWEQESDWNR